MNKPSDMSLYDEEAIEYILSLEPVKPPAEQISNGFFSKKTLRWDILIVFQAIILDQLMIIGVKEEGVNYDY